MFDRAFGTWAAQFVWFLLFSLATRIAVFGDTNFFHDELFYFIVGQRMHDGLLPYADLWDRKGPGLFLTYYLIAGLSRSVIAFQAAAWVSAALTAMVVARIASRNAGTLGSVLAGMLYLAILPMFGGAGGQSPVFYNLWMALAALGVVRALPALRRGRLPRVLYAAMGSAGFAITFKQTAVCEAVFLGCFVLWELRRAGMPLPRIGAVAMGLALTGAAPMLVFAAFYAGAGHFAEFWHAMVTSNLTKTYNAGDDAGMRIIGLTLLFLPALLLALFGIALTPRSAAVPRAFLIGWLVAAIAGVAIVPNFFDHYMLPVAVCTSVAAARALEYKMGGPVAGLVAMFFFISTGPSFDFAARYDSRIAMDRIAADILARKPDARLFIYQGPIYLYALLDRYPPTPVFYPYHLSFPAEQGTAFRNITGEVGKVLDWRPDVVVTAHGISANNENAATGALVHAYVRQNCRLWFTRDTIEMLGPAKIDVWGDCARH